MPQKLDVNELISQINKEVKKREKIIKKTFIEEASGIIDFNLKAAEKLFFQYCASLIDSMKGLSEERIDQRLNYNVNGEHLPLLAGYRWLALKNSTIARKHHKKMGRPALEGKYLWTGKLRRDLSRKTKRITESRTIITNDYIKYKPSMTSLLEVMNELNTDDYNKVVYNEVKRPLIGPMMESFVVNLLPRKLRKTLDDRMDYIVSRTKKEITR